MAEPRLLACIDTTQGSRAMDVTWLTYGENRVFAAKLRDVTAVLDWVDQHRPHIFAIDAPCKENVGRTNDTAVQDRYGFEKDRYKNCRLAEALLKQRNIQIYATPREIPDKSWIRTGLRIYREIEVRFGYQLWLQPGHVDLMNADARTLIEVYPHAAYVVGLGRRPNKKTTLVGQLERSAYLLREGNRRTPRFSGDPWPDASVLENVRQAFTELTWGGVSDDGVQLPSLPSHDLLDSLAGLMTACACMEGSAFALGETAEGVIVLPHEPLARYK